MDVVFNRFRVGGYIEFSEEKMEVERKKEKRYLIWEIEKEGRL